MEGRVAFYQASIAKSLETGGANRHQGVDTHGVLSNGTPTSGSAALGTHHSRVQLSLRVGTWANAGGLTTAPLHPQRKGSGY